MAAAEPGTVVALERDPDPVDPCADGTATSRRSDLLPLSRAVAGFKVWRPAAGEEVMAMAAQVDGMLAVHIVSLST